MLRVSTKLSTQTAPPHTHDSAHKLGTATVLTSAGRRLSEVTTTSLGHTQRSPQTWLQARSIAGPAGRLTRPRTRFCDASNVPSKGSLPEEGSVMQDDTHRLNRKRVHRRPGARDRRLGRQATRGLAQRLPGSPGAARGRRPAAAGEPGSGAASFPAFPTSNLSPGLSSSPSLLWAGRLSLASPTPVQPAPHGC